MSQTVIGIFDNADNARDAVRKLVDDGFDESNVDFARGSRSEGHVHDEKYSDHESGISRFFKNLFNDTDESNRYARVANKGCIVTVHAQSTDEARRASEILDECGAVDIDEKDREYTDEVERQYEAEQDRKYIAEEARKDAARRDRREEAEKDREYITEKDRQYDVERDRDYAAEKARKEAIKNEQGEAAEKEREYIARKDREDAREYPNANPDSYFDKERKETRKIPVIEETLNVGKKVVEKGGVRVRSRIVEKPVEKTIRLREEHVHVERNKVDKPVTDTELKDFQEGTIEVKERAEVPVVTKDAKVIEEVGLNKTVEEREETIRDKVRTKEVDVEKVPPENRRTD